MLERLIKRGFSALLLAMLLPAAGYAQANISQRTVNDWQVRHVDGDVDGYRNVMRAFDGGQWDGWTVVQLDEDENRFGAVVLEKGDARTLALLQNDEEGWRIVDRFDDLFDMWPQADVSLSFGYSEAEREAGRDPLGLIVYLRKADGGEIACGFSGEIDCLFVEWFACWDIGEICALIPEIRDLRPDSGTLTARESLDGIARVSAEAYRNENQIVNAHGHDEMRALRVPIGETRLRDMLSWMAQCIARRDDPMPIPYSDTIPQPQLASFEKGRRFDVYTGPGTGYFREANGKAMVSTNDWIQVFGEEDGWLLIQYHVSDGKNRFGYIRATQEEACVRVPRLAWTNARAVCHSRFLTTDPIRHWDEIMDFGLEGQRCTLLGTLSEFCYVETTLSSGELIRGFVFNASGEAVTLEGE